MANANPGYQNGFIHDSMANGPAHTDARAPFTLQGALPYSPQTSISPFVAGTSVCLRRFPSWNGP